MPRGTIFGWSISTGILFYILQEPFPILLWFEFYYSLIKYHSLDPLFSDEDNAIIFLTIKEDQPQEEQKELLKSHIPGKGQYMENLQGSYSLNGTKPVSLKHRMLAISKKNGSRTNRQSGTSSDEVWFPPRNGRFQPEFSMLACPSDNEEDYDQ